MPKLVWRVKLVAELQPGVTTETEVARIERDADANLTELGLRLEEAKQLTAALQAQIVPAQVPVLSECRRSCVACGSVLASKGHYPVRFRSLFGDVPLRIRRLLTCPCQGGGEAKSSAILDFNGNAVAPGLTYLTARYAALAPFGKVAALLSNPLPKCPGNEPHGFACSRKQAGGRGAVVLAPWPGAGTRDAARRSAPSSPAPSLAPRRPRPADRAGPWCGPGRAGGQGPP